MSKKILVLLVIEAGFVFGRTCSRRKTKVENVCFRRKTKVEKGCLRRKTKVGFCIQLRKNKFCALNFTSEKLQNVTFPK